MNRSVQPVIPSKAISLTQDAQLGKMQIHYPKLFILSSLLQQSRTDVAPTNTADWHNVVASSMDLITELIQYIQLPLLESYLEYQYLAREVKAFHSTVESIFQASGTTGDNLGDYSQLRDDEINFIRRAYRLNTLSTSLFTVLRQSTGCDKTHDARIHLSGFLDSDLSFDVSIAACESNFWKCAKCRW